MRFERRHEPLLPFRSFLVRLLRSTLVAAFFILVSLGIGVVGYHRLAHLPWLDSLLNASMILAGMGPVDRVSSAAGKWFASGYALFSGVAFLTGVGVFMAPIAHRLLHHFHLAIDDEKEKRPRRPDARS